MTTNKERNSWDNSDIGNIEDYKRDSWSSIKFYEVEGLEKVVAMYHNEIWLLTHEGDEVYKVDHAGQITDNFHIPLMKRIDAETIKNVRGLLQSKRILTEEADQWAYNAEKEKIHHKCQTCTGCNYHTFSETFSCDLCISEECIGSLSIYNKGDE